MSNCRVLVVALVLLLAAGAGGPAAARAAATREDKINNTPDLLGKDAGGKVPEGCCGPYAVSNSLVWLARKGFTRLLPPGGDEINRQIELVRILSTRQYMSTEDVHGTSTASLIRGLYKYIRKKGYDFNSLEYQGVNYRSVPGRFCSARKSPDLRGLKEKMEGIAVAWLEVGYFKYDALSDEYTRIGGHWVTLVGFEKTGNTMIVHDNTGKQPSHDIVKLVPLRSGTLYDERYRGRPVVAAGCYILKGDFETRLGADFSVLEGIVVLEMKVPRRRDRRK